MEKSDFSIFGVDRTDVTLILIKQIPLLCPL